MILLFLLNSFFVMVLMSVDRLLYICKPLQYERLAKPQVMVAIIIIVFIIDIIISLSDIWNSEYGSFYPPFLLCVEEFSIFSMAVVMTVVALALVVLLVSNIWFFVIVMRNIKAVYGAQKCSSRKRESKLDHFISTSKNVLYQKQARLYLMVLALIFSTVLPWVLFVGVVMAYRLGQHEVSPVLAIMMMLLLYSQTVVHPIIETLLIPDVRNPLVRLVTCRRRIRREDTTLTLDRTKSSAANRREVNSGVFNVPNLFNNVSI